MMNNLLRYTSHQVNSADVEAVNRVLNSGCLSRGPEVEAFEDEFANYVGSKYAVAVTSGTAALHLAAMVSGTASGHIVQVPDITFVATANAPLLCGAKVELYDNMDPSVRGFKHMVIHYAGEPYHIRDCFIEDAAHALGAAYDDGAKVGSCPESQMTCFSFHPAKHITCGEGGMVTTNDLQLRNRLRQIRNNGITRPYTEEPWRYSWESVGLNYEMSEINAALGRSQLNRIDDNLRVRRRIAEYYYEELSQSVQPVVSKDFCEEIYQRPWCSYHLFPVLIDFLAIGKSRQQVMTELLKRGIETQVHYVPLHMQPMFADKVRREDFHHAEKFYEQELSLPMSHSMTVEDAERVCKALKEVL